MHPRLNLEEADLPHVESFLVYLEVFMLHSEHFFIVFFFFLQELQSMFEFLTHTILYKLRF